MARLWANAILKLNRAQLQKRKIRTLKDLMRERYYEYQVAHKEVSPEVMARIKAKIREQARKEARKRVWIYFWAFLVTLVLLWIVFGIVA